MLEIEGLYKSYNEKNVLSDVSFSIKNGEICGLVGLNGAGKSTIMKIVCAMVRADSGEVRVDGKRVEFGKSNSGKVGYMIESPAFYPGMTGRQNLRALASLYDGIDDNRIDLVLKAVGLVGQANFKVGTYSLGMKQRLYFAYAMMCNPTTLILDEPFNGIDPITVKFFRDAITDMAKVGCAVLVSSHVLSDLKEISDKIIIIDKGTIVYDKPNDREADLEGLFISLVSGGGVAQ